MRTISTSCLESAALTRVLAERGSAAKIADFEAAGEATGEALLSRAKVIGSLRLVNHRDDLGLKFDGLDIASLLDEDSLRVVVEKAVQVLLQRSQSAVEAGALQASSDAVLEGDIQARELCSGHDAVAILSFGLRRVLGTQKALDVRVDMLELELRLAYDRDCFTQTGVFAALREWELRNAGWRVLSN
jgi:hypothetical protein